MLAVLVILGGSLSAFAIEPVRVQVWGAVQNTGEFDAYPCYITSVGNNTFVCSMYGAPDVLSPCTYIYLYFAFDASSISSFDLKLSIDGTRYNNNSLTDRGNLTDNTIGLWEYQNNTFVNNINIRTQVTGSTSLVDGVHHYEWFWRSNTSYNKNCLRVTLPYNTFVATNGFRFEFTIDSFVVNGVETVFTAGEQTVINNLVSINEAINEDVPLPSAVPSLEEIGGEIVNEGLDLAQSWVQYFTTNFDIAGAMGRVIKPFSDFFLEIPSDGNTAHTTLVIISLFSLGAVIVVWLINKLKRRQDDA